MGHVITNTLKSGAKSYVARYQASDGKRRSKSFKYKRDAVAFLKHTEAQVQRREWVPPELQQATLYQLLHQAADAQVRATTKRLKLAAANNLGSIRDIPVSQLTPEDIENWLSVLRTGRPWANQKPLSESSTRMYYAQVKAVLNQQVRARRLTVSPADLVKAPTSVTKVVTKASLITTTELEQLIHAAASTPSKMILVQASTGLRPGELCGLRVGSLQGNLLHITHQSGTNAKQGLQPLKTAASQRSVPVPTQALAALQELAQGREPDQPMFVTRKNSGWTSTTYGEAFSTAVERAGIRHCTPHSLRHYYASLLIAAGLDVRTVQHRLGHATPTETLNTYTHLWADNPEVTTAAVDNVLRPAP